MPPSYTTQAIAATSRATLSLLSEQGFKRRAVHLLRQSEDVLHCIHFQASRWGSSNEGQFTANLVVTWQAAYETWTGNQFPANPATAAYPIQLRIGLCLPERCDTWWPVNADTKPDSLATEVSSVIAEHAPLFFARFSSTHTVLENLRECGSLPGLTRKHARLVHAQLAQSTGSIEEAKEILTSEWQAAAKSPFQATIRSFARRIGLELPAST